MVWKMAAILPTCLALALVPLMIGGCRTQKAERDFADELPIIIIDTSGLPGEATLHFTCLNRKECPPALETGVGPGDSVMDREANLYLPLSDRDEICYVDTEQGVARYVETDLDRSPIPLYAHNKIILGRRSGIVIIDEDLSQEIIQLELAGESGEIGGLVHDDGNEVLAFNESPVKKGGQDFAQIFVINLDSSDVREELLPAPPSVEGSPNAPAEERWGRYALTIVGIGENLDRLYYTFRRGDKERIQLAMFDTREKKELRVYERRCLPIVGYRQHGGYLFVESGRGGPLLLSLEDLSPVVNFAKLRTDFPVREISPLGHYFLAGTANEVLVLSRDGDVLKEYTLPPDLFGGSYAFVEYLGDSENDD
jgi:hypothetical protein